MICPDYMGFPHAGVPYHWGVGCFFSKKNIVFRLWRVLHLLFCVCLGSREYRLFDLARINHCREKDALASPA